METMWSKSKKLLTTHAEAYNFCLDKLALRDHSTRELRQKLGERGCPEELQDQVLQKLADHHFVDDARCARSVLDAWRRKKFYGKQYLRLMLTRRCLSGEDAREALGEVTEEEETGPWPWLRPREKRSGGNIRKTPERPKPLWPGCWPAGASAPAPSPPHWKIFPWNHRNPQPGFPPLARD